MSVKIKYEVSCDAPLCEIKVVADEYPDGWGRYSSMGNNGWPSGVIDVCSECVRSGKTGGMTRSGRWDQSARSWEVPTFVSS